MLVGRAGVAGVSVGRAGVGGVAGMLVGWAGRLTLWPASGAPHAVSASASTAMIMDTCCCI
jgi:hypothetical protein